MAKTRTPPAQPDKPTKYVLMLEVEFQDMSFEDAMEGVTHLVTEARAYGHPTKGELTGVPPTINVL